ncbi:hypothetical protein BU23DRAFT_570110 [Bimuria novae-zelandiae CBS 107.79]|uniref:Protein kinase domain-containing protein n=1 Tax=Bimuria novae-zelandiae CBS 107.79 TaxID=1447943 RepID=A0A6A5V268_9PLEO|nr:hypothetical protein BU23DRAFT_570110 [Bimuria novae-zelandiae CBS 107.79]
MFLSFGGKRISQCLTTGNRPLITTQVDDSAQAIHNLGVLHKDLEPRNILWNEDTGRVMLIDFERAEEVKQRTVLGIISANRKRKRVPDASQNMPGPAAYKCRDSVPVQFQQSLVRRLDIHTHSGCRGNATQEFEEDNEHEEGNENEEEDKDE